MAPSKAPTSWEEEEDSDSSSGPASPPVAAAVRRTKFEDEEDDEDVASDWEEEDDSEAEKEKAKKAAEAKAKAEAEAKAAHKTKTQKIEERIEAKRKAKQDVLEESSEEEESEGERLARARESEKASDLKNAEDLFSGIGVSDKRGNKPVTVVNDDDPGNAIDLSSLKLFAPATAPQFKKLHETLVPLLSNNSKKPQYALFLPEFVKALAKDLTSDQVKKVAGVLNTLSNEKMKEEKAAEKGGKKSKAAKTKTTLNASRDVSRVADTAAYDDGGLDE